MQRLASLILFLIVLAGLLQPRSATAADAVEIDRLWSLMRMPEVVAVMRSEGQDYGKSLDADMLDGQGGADWAAAVDAIYDARVMERSSRADFGAALRDTDVTAIIAFFESPLGAKAIGLELAARQTMLDPSLDEAARSYARDLRAQGDPRMDLIDRFAAVNDMIETNVAGALNANYAFLKGLSDGGALGADMDDAAILAEVWGQEADVRNDTEAWVDSYLTLAYQPLTDADLTAYIDFSASDAGQQLNRAIFFAFDNMFNDIAERLGKAVALRLAGEEL